MEKKDWSLLPLINNTDAAKKRFEFHIENEIACIEYILATGDVIYLTHTEVPRSLEGKGLGSAIIKKTLEYIREKGYQLVPLCPFVAAYIKMHPEVGEGLLKKGYSV